MNVLNVDRDLLVQFVVGEHEFDAIPSGWFVIHKHRLSTLNDEKGGVFMKI